MLRCGSNFDLIYSLVRGASRTMARLFLTTIFFSINSFVKSNYDYALYALSKRAFLYHSDASQLPVQMDEN